MKASKTESAVDDEEGRASGTTPHDRRRRAPRSILIACGAIAGLLLPQLVASAAPLFSDVSVSHPFYEEIEWMGATGISTGYPDGTYRPADAVTRQSMSAFMQRLYDLQEDMDWAYKTASFSGFTADTWTDLPDASVTVTVPDGVYADIVARFNATTRCRHPVATETYYCSARLVISKDGGPFTPMPPYPAFGTVFDAAEPNDTAERSSLEAFASGEPGSTYTIKVQGYRAALTSYFYLQDWSLVAETDLQTSDYTP